MSSLHSLLTQISIFLFDFVFYLLRLFWQLRFSFFLFDGVCVWVHLLFLYWSHFMDFVNKTDCIVFWLFKRHYVWHWNCGSVVKVLEVHVELLIVFQRRKKFLLLPLLISTFPFWTLMTWKEREKERKMERGWKWGRKMSAECKFWKKSENECLYSRHKLLEKTVEMNLTCLALNIFKFQLFSFCRRSYSKQW